MGRFPIKTVAVRKIRHRDGLQKLLQPNFAELLAAEYASFANDVHDLFRIVYNPRLMFPFNGFRSLFAREVIPLLAVMNRSPIVFNPARLITFGNP